MNSPRKPDARKFGLWIRRSVGALTLAAFAYLACWCVDAYNFVYPPEIFGEIFDTRGASMPQQLERLRRLAKECPDLNSCYYRHTNTTPLTYACAHGSATQVRILVEEGAGVDTLDLFDMCPIQMAAVAGKSDIIATLLSLGANPNLICPTGESILAWLTVSEVLNMKRATAAKLLLHAGADPAIGKPSAMACAIQRQDRTLIDLYGRATVNRDH